MDTDREVASETLQADNGDGQTQRVVCDECETEYALAPHMRVDTLPGKIYTHVIVCPECGTEVISHYSSYALQLHRERLKKALDRYRGSQNGRNWQRYMSARDEYHGAFDRLQKRMRREGSKA